MTRHFLLSLALIAASGSATAQTCTTSWAAPVDGSWSDDAMWTNGAPGTTSGGLSPCITAAGTYTVSYDIGVFGGSNVDTFVLGGASGTQTLTLLSALGVTDAAIRPNGLLITVGNVGNGQGLYATGTVTLEGVVQNGSGSFLRSGGTLDIAPSGTLRLSGQTGAGAAAGLFRVRGTIEGVGCPVPNGGECRIDAPLDVLGGTLRATDGVLRTTAGGTMNGATLDAGPAGFLTLNANAAGPQYAMTVEGVIQGTPQGQVGMSGLNLYAGPAGATLAVNGTGFQMFGTSFLRSGGGSFTNTGLLLKAATGSNFSGLAEVIVRNTGVIEIPSSLGLYVGSVLRNEPGGVVRATGAGRLSGDGDGTGRFENAGLFVLDAPGQSFTFGDGGFGRNSGPYSRPGSEMRVLAGTLDLNGPGSRNLSEGASLTGSGSVSVPGSFQPEGTVSPGTPEQPLARLTHGWYYYPSSLTGFPRLVIDVDTGGRSDTLYVGSGFGPTGARLAGALVVRVRPGYVPAVGDAFTILKVEGVIEGQFATIVSDGAPEDIAFVTELSADARTLTLRAVPVAPGGPITVSDTAPVAGGYRTLFLTGPGASGVSSARLECVDCLDTEFYDVIPGVMGDLGDSRTTRFDLTNPRAFGFYNLVLTQPGLPDDVRPVTIRPYLSSVRAEVLVNTGIRARPAGEGFNFSPYQFTNVTNAPVSAVPFSLVEREEADRLSMALTSAHSISGAYYNTETAPDPTEPPLSALQIPSNGSLTYEIGLRIDPEEVLFPEQTRTGPEDDRLPFGSSLLTNVLTTSNTSFEKAAFTTQQGLRNASFAFAPLEQYLDAVDAADAGAVTSAVESTLRGSSRLVASTEGLLESILSDLNLVVPTPGGLADVSLQVFSDSLSTAVYDLAQREVDATQDAFTTASPEVAALLQGELDALGIVYDLDGESRSASTHSATAAVAAGGGLPTSGEYSTTASGGTNFRGPIPESPTLPFGFGGGVVSTSPAANGIFGPGWIRTPGDPNDKLGDTALTCQFGTVTVGGEEQPGCVRYFVPLARAAEPVEYAILFENIPEATASAEFVTITDVLDPSFNPATLEVLSTSSDSTFSYSVSGQTVTFRFTGINLPPNTTPPNGEGYVSFRVRPTTPLAEGTELRNEASIVFDFNPAILTRTVVHEVRQVADLATVIDAPDFIQEGQPFAFRVLASNLQGDAASDATATITTGTAIATATPSSGTCTGAGTGSLVCDLGDLEAEEVVTIDITLDAPARGLYTFSSTVTTTAFDGFAANDADAVAAGVVGVGIEEDDSGLPREVTLSTVRPNPARGAATLRWGLPAAGHADVRVYDLLGREVAVLAEGESAPAGWHETRWNADVASGVYVVRFAAEIGGQTTVRTRPMVVVR